MLTSSKIELNDGFYLRQILLDVNAEIMRNSPLQHIKSTRGLTAKIARRLGVSWNAVAKWTRIPEKYVIEVEEVTGISREELCPHLYKSREK